MKISVEIEDLILEKAEREFAGIINDYYIKATQAARDRMVAIQDRFAKEMVGNIRDAVNKELSRLPQRLPQTKKPSKAKGER